MKETDEKKYAKPHLPAKTCAACGKSMAWRKRWAKVWAEVKFCSERCRRQNKTAKS